MKSFLTISFFAIFIQSCSHLKSGKYIRITKGETPQSLARKYGVPPAALLNANPKKRWVGGEWIFVPLKRGVIPMASKRNVLYPRSGGGQFFNSKFLWPVPIAYKVSSNFGLRNGRPHNGIDIPAPVGSYIVAVDNGEVIHSGNSMKGYGNLTIISHPGNVYSVYAHAKKNLTRRGQKVFRGQIIGLVGTTGKTSGPHLHFEVRKGEKAIPPMAYFLKK